MKAIKANHLSENDIFSDEPISIEEAKRILGKKITKNMTDEEIRDEVSKIRYLAESWLDEYEKSIFDGKTLQEILSDPDHRIKKS